MEWPWKDGLGTYELVMSICFRSQPCTAGMERRRRSAADFYTVDSNGYLEELGRHQGASSLYRARLSVRSPLVMIGDYKGQVFRCEWYESIPVDKFLVFLHWVMLADGMPIILHYPGSVVNAWGWLVGGCRVRKWLGYCADVLSMMEITLCAS